MKGICFKEYLFHKVVDGTKTQSRRIIFPNTDYTVLSQPSFEGMETDPEDCYKLDKEGEMICYKDGEPKLVTFKGTFGLFEGDQFFFDNSYVRTRYQPGEVVYLKEPWCTSTKGWIYKFDGIEIPRWYNKLFMPERAARHFIQITDVIAQRLQEITEPDALAEGFTGISSFQSMWISIHGFRSWPDNPWVWKYTFKLTNKPQNVSRSK